MKQKSKRNKLGRFLGNRAEQGPLTKLRIYRYSGLGSPERESQAWLLYGRLINEMINCCYHPIHGFCQLAAYGLGKGNDNGAQ